VKALKQIGTVTAAASGCLRLLAADILRQSHVRKGVSVRCAVLGNQIKQEASPVGNLRGPIVWMSVLVLSVMMTIGAAAVPTTRVLWEPLPLAPGLDQDPGLPRASGSADIIDSLRLAGLQVTLEQTAFDELQRHFGGTLGRRGEAGNNRRWLCYYQTRAPSRWIIWLEGDELHQTNVAGFQWRTMPPFSMPDRRCQPLPGNRAVRLPVAVRLGQSRVGVRAALGPPTTDYGSTFLYVHSHSVRVASTPFTVINTVVIQFRGDKVEAIGVWRSSTS
jgi:hypothetical protein